MSRPIHFEIAAEDLDKLSAFYSDVFGWQFSKWDGPMEYRLITTGPDGQPGINGGLMKKEHLTGTVNTIGVESIDAALEKVKAAGGDVLTPKMDIPNIGAFAYCADPEGNPFGIIQPAAS